MQFAWQSAKLYQTENAHTHTFFSAGLQSFPGRVVIITRPCKNYYSAGKKVRVRTVLKFGV